MQQLLARNIRDERVLEAMARVPRELFVPDDLRERAYDDAALPIGCDQTISQPAMVAHICALLTLQGRERVLDVGTGSGYQAAVLAELAAEVHTIERIPELAEQARAHLRAAGYGDRVVVHVGDGTLGDPSMRPSTRSPSPPPPPGAAPGALRAARARGRLVLPVGNRHDQELARVVRAPTGPKSATPSPAASSPLWVPRGSADVASVDPWATPTT